MHCLLFFHKSHFFSPCKPKTGYVFFKSVICHVYNLTTKYPNNIVLLLRFFVHRILKVINATKMSQWRFYNLDLEIKITFTLIFRKMFSASSSSIHLLLDSGVIQ